jgi:hypothetical protein
MDERIGGHKGSATGDTIGDLCKDAIGGEQDHRDIARLLLAIPGSLKSIMVRREPAI